MRGLPFYVKREAFARADIRQRVAYILSAEDMDDNYLLYKIYLEKKYNLIRAENGEELF